MGLNLVPSGQDGVTVTVTPGDPATVRWPSAAPAFVKVTASGGTARFSLRGNAAPDSSGVVVVPDGQTATVSTRVEATPITVRVATDSTVSVTVTGFRDVDTGVSTPYPVVTPPSSGVAKLSELTDVDKTGAAPGKVVTVSTTSGGAVTGWGLANPVTGGSGAVSSVAGKVGDVTLTKADVGLNNVNNTADANKPISSATQTALDGKAAANDARLTDQREPSDASVTNAKVASNAAISLDKTADGSTNRVYTTAEKNKLAGVATGATMNTTAASIPDFTEAVQDAVAALLGSGSNVTLNYDDAANSLTISATGAGGTGLDAEQVRDAIGVALVGVGNIAVTVNDAADTITISTTATQNATDAALRDRDSHTDGATYKGYTATEKTKLAGIAAGATAYTDELAQDAAAALLAAGSHTGISFVYNDAGNALSATVSGGGSTDPEVVRDTIAAALVQGANIAITANDAADTITIAVTGLTKSSVGLGNVDNTSDANKLVSTAQQAAIDAKTRLTVDGVFASTYNIDTTPVAPGDIGAQPADDDLTALAGLTPANDDVVQRKSGVWTNRTPAQLKADLPTTRIVTEYTTAGTTSNVAVPATALGALVTLVGGSGAGGGGRRGAAATVRGGGAGGGQGGYIEDFWIPVSLLGSTYSVTVGAGGSAGAAATADNTNGGNGGGGGDTSFTSGASTIKTLGGPGGGGGTTGGGTSPGYAGAPLQPNTGIGLSADSAGGNGPSLTEGYSLSVPGGAAGGGITAADVAGNGGGGAPGIFFGVTAATGGVSGGASPGAAQLKAWHQGFPGGGGAASKTAAAQSGASGLRCPGSGGGASLNGFNSGAGGAGGAGLVRVQFVLP